MTAVHDELLAFVAANAASADANRRISDVMFEALERSGLLSLKLPSAVGGNGSASLLDLFDVYETLARVDGSVAWLVAFMGTAAAYPAARLPDDAIGEVLDSGGGRWPAFAGTFPPSGIATPCQGGYRLLGRWGFASGIHHARWVVAGCVSQPDETARDLLWCVVPIDDVSVHDTWHALGLRGTGSSDYSVEDVFVPEHRVFHLSNQPRRGEALHRLPMHAFLTPDHTAISLGSARRALDAAAEAASGKVRIGSTTSLDQRGAFLRDLGRADTRLRAARALVREVLADLDGGAQVTPQLMLDARVAATHAAETVADVAGTAYRASGAHAVLESSAVSRAYRDAMTSTQHVHVLDEFYEHQAEVMLRQVPAPRA